MVFIQNPHAIITRFMQIELGRNATSLRDMGIGGDREDASDNGSYGPYQFQKQRMLEKQP